MFHLSSLHGCQFGIINKTKLKVRGGMIFVSRVLIGSLLMGLGLTHFQ